MTRFGARGRWLDLLLAAALTVLGQVELWSGLVVGGPRVAVAPVLAVGTMAVAFRRRAPMTVVVVCFGCWSVEALMGMASDSAFAPVLASFLAVGSAAFYARRPVVALIVAILLISPAILVESGWAPGDLIYAAVLILLAWSVGRAFAMGNLRAQLAEQRANAAVAHERVEIARELHDIVAHSISVMTLHAGGVRRLLRPEQDRERDALDVVEQTGRQALAELQRILGVLRTPADRPLDARPGLADIGDLLAVGPRDRPGRRAAGRGRAAAAARRRRPVGVPDHAGGADERAEARRGRARFEVTSATTTSARRARRHRRRRRARRDRRRAPDTG